MTWKKVDNADAGTADKFGGNDLDKIADAFNGVDVSDPINYNVDINALKATTNALGDILKNNGTKYVRLARGTANQVLAVNAGGTDITWTTLSAGSGDITAGANVGTGAGLVFKDKTGSTLNFKRLAAGTNVTVTDGTSDVTIASTGGGGAALVETFNYFIYKDPADSIYKARNGSTGAVLGTTSATNLATVLDAVIAAISPAGAPALIEIGPGDFNLTTGVTSIDSTKVGNITIRGRGPGLTNLILTTSITGNPTILDIAGASTGSQANLTANATIHTSTATIADTTNFAVNDYVILRSTKDWIVPGQGKQGEIRQIRSKTSTVLTFDGPIQDTYNTADTANVKKLIMLKDITIEGFTIKPISSSYTQTGRYIRGTFCKNLVFRNIHVYNMPGSLTNCAEMRSCLDSKMDHVMGIMEEGFPLTGSHPYCLKFAQACHSCTMETCSVIGPWRHLVASEGSEATDTEGACRGITIQNCVCRGVKDSGFDTHENGEDIAFVNCVVEGGEEHGFNVRSPGVQVKNCTVVGVDDYGIYLFQDAKDCIITGNSIKRAGSGIRLADSTARVIISNNKLQDCGDHGIHLGNSVTDIQIIGNEINNCNTAANNAGIYDVSVATTGTNRITVVANRIVNNHRAIRMLNDSTGWKIAFNTVETNNNTSQLTGTNKLWGNTGDTSLVDNMTAGGGAAILDELTDVAITSATRGDIIIRDATQFVNKAKGTAGQVLTMDGTGTDPVWATPTGGGGGSGTVPFVLYADHPNASTMGTSYLSLAGGNQNTTLGNRSIEIGYDLTITAMRARVQTNSLNTGTLTLGFVDDGVVVATCTMAAGATGMAETTGLNVSIAAGSVCAISLNTGTAASGSYEVRPISIEGTVTGTGAGAAKVYGHTTWYMYIDTADANKIKATDGTTELIHATDAGELIMDIFDAMAATPFTIHVAPGDYPLLTWTKARTAKSNWAIIGSGVGVTNFVADNTITTADIMILSGDPVAATSDLPLTANATAGAMSVTMSSGNGATLTTNDYILIKSTKNFSAHASSVNDQGEIKRVKTIASGVITVDTPLHDTYNTADTAAVREMNFLKNIRLQDLSIIPESGYTGSGTFLRALFCDNMAIENVEVKNNYGQFGSGFHLSSCINTRLIHPVCRFDPTWTDNSQYGIALSDACENVIIDSPLIIGRYRHGIVVAAGSGGSNSQGVNRQIEVNQGMIYGGFVCAYDTHMEGEYIRFNDCTVVGMDPAAATVAGGFQARCRKVEFNNPQVINNVGFGIFLFEDAHGCRISGGKIAKVRRISTATHGYGIWISTDVTDIEIRGTLIENCGSDAIKMAGGNARTKIIDCTLKDNARETTGYGIACSSGTAAIDCSIKQNTILGNTAAINLSNEIHAGWDIQTNRCEGNTNLSVIKGSTHSIRDNRGLTGFDEDILMNRTATSRLKFGGHAISTATGGNGVLSSFVTALGTGTFALGFTDTDGARADFTTATASGDHAGFRTSSTLTRRVRLGALYFKFSVSSITTTNLFIGLTSNTTTAMTGTDPLNARHGVAVVINGGHFRVAHNDGSGVTVFDPFDIVQTADTSAHTAKIMATSTGYIVDWDDGDTSRTITTDVPASGQGLGGQAMIEASAAAAARTMNIYWFEGYF